jgi:hypothetical protein
MPRFTLVIRNVEVLDEHLRLLGSNYISIGIEALNATEAHQAAGQRLTRALNLLAWVDRLPPEHQAKTAFERLMEGGTADYEDDPT